MLLHDSQNGFEEYEDENFAYFAKKEAELRPDPNYIVKQPGLTWRDRSYAVSLLMRIRNDFRFKQETLYLSVNILDRYLSSRIVQRDRIQCLAIGAILIALKYEEKRYNSSEIQSIIRLSSTADMVDVLRGELVILTELDFNLGWPGPTSFLHRINQVDNREVTIRILTHYLLEVALLNERFVGQLPSLVAAASYCLARQMLGYGNWVSVLFDSVYDLMRVDKSTRPVVGVQPTTTLSSLIYVNRTLQARQKASSEDP